ncbi:MAG: hypothetical protein IKE69_11440 [Thermoguttaceae bacterium]|nr:hypothetical protein [Thermoguttaceae bacterium]
MPEIEKESLTENTQRPDVTTLNFVPDDEMYIYIDADNLDAAKLNLKRNDD